jgi:hypothetical protein
MSCTLNLILFLKFLCSHLKLRSTPLSIRAGALPAPDSISPAPLEPPIASRDTSSGWAIGRAKMSIVDRTHTRMPAKASPVKTNEGDKELAAVAIFFGIGMLVSLALVILG